MSAGILLGRAEAAASRTMRAEQLRARRDPTARRQLQGSSAALHPGAEGLRRVRMEADARVAKLGQKARHPPLKRPRRRAVAAPVRVRSLGLVPITAAARTHTR